MFTETLAGLKSQTVLKVGEYNTHIVLCKNFCVIS